MFSLFICTYVYIYIYKHIIQLLYGACYIFWQKRGKPGDFRKVKNDLFVEKFLLQQILQARDPPLKKKLINDDCAIGYFKLKVFLTSWYNALG